MSAFSDATEADILNHMMRTSTWSKPTPYLELYEVAPTDAGGGTVASYSTYARTALTQSDAAWTVTITASGIEIENTGTVSFPTPTANGTDLVAASVFGSAGGADMIMHGAITNAPVPVQNGVPIEFAAGDLKFRIVEFVSGEATDRLYNLILDHIFRTSTWAKGSANLQQMTTMPAKDGTGGVEFSGSGYAAISSQGDANWSAPTTAGTTTNIQLDYPTATAAWSNLAGTIIHDGTGALLRKTYAAALNVPNGGTLSFPAGSIVVTVA